MIFTDVVSPFSKETRDDFTVAVDQGKLSLIEGTCPATEQAFDNINHAAPTSAWRDGHPCSLDEGLEAAREILQRSAVPLFFGMGTMGTNSHRAAIGLAERCGGIIDTAGSPLARACLAALQQVGLSTCSLGEIKQRADLVVIWGADPETTHPGLLDRLQITSPSQTLTRSVIVIDGQLTATAKRASQFIQIHPENFLDTILALRQQIREQNIQGDASSSNPDPLQQLAKQLRECRYGTILFGPAMASGPTPELTVTSLYRLVEELCAQTRFTARALGESNAENVLAWQTGYASAIDFHHGYPQSLPGEFLANELLKRRDVDCAVILGSRSLTHLSKQAIESLEALPTILVEPVSQKSGFSSSVKFAVAVDGIHTRDTIYRFDEIALPMRSFLTTSLPTIEEVLTALGDQRIISNTT
ncbi:MAG TPA: molybdopterin-dependent oxidoreductase [Planctomicrobium sp.]|nr:molybdopterin-dependent oxidoreductase [Planctomicrobium sp.]